MFDGLVRAPAAAMMAGAVKQDAEEPGAKVCAELKVGKLPPGGEECVLEHILGGILMTQEPDGGAEQGVLMAAGFGGKVLGKTQGVHVEKFVRGGNKVTVQRDIGSWFSIS